MINLEITVRHASLGDDVDAFVKEKVTRLEKYLSGSPRIEVILDRDNEQFRCEMIVHSSRKGSHMVAHVTHEDPRACIDMVIEKLGRHLARFKDKGRYHKRGVRREDDARASSPSGEEGGNEPSYEDIVQREIKGD